MSIEYVLFNLGFGAPFALILAIAAGVGWFIRREAGFVIVGGFTAAVVSFTAIAVDVGSVSLTKRSLYMVAGASILSSGITFALVYGIVARVINDASKAGGNLLVSIALVGLAIAGAISATVIASLLLGFPWQDEVVQGLIVYGLLLGAVAYAVSEWHENDDKARLKLRNSVSGNSVSDREAVSPPKGDQDKPVRPGSTVSANASWDIKRPK